MSAIVTYADTSNMFADTSKITLDKINQGINGSSATGGGGAGGGGSGTQQVFTGASPPATPTNPAIAAVFYPTGSGSIQQWDVASQAWL